MLERDIPLLVVFTSALLVAVVLFGRVCAHYIFRFDRNNSQYGWLVNSARHIEFNIHYKDTKRLQITFPSRRKPIEFLYAFKGHVTPARQDVTFEKSYPVNVSRFSDWVVLRAPLTTANLVIMKSLLTREGVRVEDSYTNNTLDAKRMTVSLAGLAQS